MKKKFAILLLHEILEGYTPILSLLPYSQIGAWIPESGNVSVKEEPHTSSHWQLPLFPWKNHTKMKGP